MFLTEVSRICQNVFIVLKELSASFYPIKNVVPKLWIVKVGLALEITLGARTLIVFPENELQLNKAPRFLHQMA